MTKEELINQRATTCRHGGHCEWVACDKCNHYEPDALSQQPCEDCISRQAVNDGFKKYASSSFAYGCVWDYVNELPSVTPKEKTGWIPVSERLPEEHTCDEGFIDPSEYVLVQLKSGYMKISRYWGSRERYKDCPWIDLSYPTTDEVIAWMPLPEPYKVGDTDG